MVDAFRIIALFCLHYSALMFPKPTFIWAVFLPFLGTFRVYCLPPAACFEQPIPTSYPAPI